MASDEREDPIIEFGCVWVHLSLVRETLASQGLHVITAEQKAVLDAMADADIYFDRALGWTIQDDSEAVAAERARRKAAGRGE